MTKIICTEKPILNQTKRTHVENLGGLVLFPQKNYGLGSPWGVKTTIKENILLIAFTSFWKIFLGPMAKQVLRSTILSSTIHFD